MNKIKELLQIEVEKAGRGVKKRCVNVYVGGWGRCVGLCKEQGQKTQLHCVSLRLKHEQPLCPTSRFRVPAHVFTASPHVRAEHQGIRGVMSNMVLY